MIGLTVIDNNKRGEIMRNIFLFLTLGFTSITFAGSHGKGMPQDASHESHGKYTITYEILDNSWDSGVNTIVGATLDEDDNGYGIVLGYDLGNNLVLEAAYRDLGQASLSGASGNTFKYGGVAYTFNATATVFVEADTLTLGLKKSFNFSDNLSVFARAGIHRYESTLGVTAATASVDTSNKDQDIYYGVGASYSMGNIHLNIAHDTYDIDYGEIDSTGISLSYNLAF